MYLNAWVACKGAPVALLMALAPALVVSASATLASPVALAVEMTVERRQQCERRGISRVVELRERPGDGLPCEVVYLKPDEDGSERVLWTAKTDRGFCAARFDAFLVKLESTLGWTCEAGDGTPLAASAEKPTEVAVVPPVAPRPVEPTRMGDDATVAASRLVSPERTVERAPELGATRLAMRDVIVASDAGANAPTPLDQLHSLAPPGTYSAVPVPSDGRPGSASVSSWCPSGSFFSWKTEDPERPVLALGETIELTVRLPDAALGGTPALPIVSSVGGGRTREFQALSPAPVEGEGTAIDIWIAPRGPGSGALSPGACRYALER